MKIIRDLFVGMKYGRITILSISNIEYKPKRIKKTVYCKCDCGETLYIDAGKFGNKKSCGCLQKEIRHRECRTDMYSIWNTIKTRCYCATSKQYCDYGGRGILTCEAFKDFMSFKKVMGERPSKKHSIDRIKNDFHYCCGECEECISNNWKKNIRWATPQEQSANKRNNIYLDYNGERLCLAEVARRIKMPQPVLHSRITVLKWSVEEAISTPINRINRYVHKGSIGRNQFSK